MHFALDFKVRIKPVEKRQRVTHLRRRWRIGSPKRGMESSATFGVIPKRRISSHANKVISATCSGVGSWFT